MDSNILTFKEQDVYMIQNAFPKTYRKFHEYIKDIFAKGEGQAPDDKQVALGLPAIILFNPRVLYDFFDKHNTFVSIFYRDGGWNYTVNDINGSEARPIRTEGEAKAFLAAFKLLEGNELL
jgi:hypothetical protein